MKTLMEYIIVLCLVLFSCQSIASDVLKKQNSEFGMINKFDIISWDEKPYLKLSDGVKYSKTLVEKEYHGRLKGKAQLEYLMVYYGEGQATFVGVEHFDGSFDGKKGSIAFEHKGIFKDGLAESEFASIVGSALHDLVGLNLQGHYSSGHSMSIEFELDVLSQL